MGGKINLEDINRGRPRAYLPKIIQTQLESVFERIKNLEAILERDSGMERLIRDKDLEYIKTVFEDYFSPDTIPYIIKTQADIKNLRRGGFPTDNLSNELLERLVEESFPAEEFTGLGNRIGITLDWHEEDVLLFAEKYLAPLIFKDKKRNNTDFNVNHHYELRCKPCNEVFEYTSDIPTIMTDVEFFGLVGAGLITPECERGHELTNYIATFNSFSPKNPLNNFYKTVSMIARRKSGGRLLAKIIDYLKKSENNGDITDVTGLRVVVSNTPHEKALLTIESEIYKQANVYQMPVESDNNLVRIVNHHLDPDSIDRKNIPRKEHETKPKYSAIHLDYAIDIERVVPFKQYAHFFEDTSEMINFFTSLSKIAPKVTDKGLRIVYTQRFEIQLFDEFGYDQQANATELDHDRMVERQEKKRSHDKKDAWGPVHKLMYTKFKDHFQDPLDRHINPDIEYQNNK